MSRQLAHEGYCGWLQTKVLTEGLVTSCSLHLWKADECHRDTEEAVDFDDDTAFKLDLKCFCALKEIFTVLSLCASMTQWQK